MRVLALISDAFGGHGGIALYNRDFLTALCEDPGTCQVVAVARTASRALEPLPDKLDYTVAAGGLLNYTRKLFGKVRENASFDLVLCGHINLMPLAWLAARYLKSPILLEIYGIEAWQPTRRALTNRLVRSASLVTSISDFTRQRFLGWSGLPESDCVLVPNAIHADAYGPGEPEDGFLRRYGLENKTVLLTFGRLVSRERAKGFDEILELLPELIERIPNPVYLIAGDGPDRRRLQEKAQALGVESSVTFTGHVPDADKADLYRAAAVYAMPSRGEGFGFVFLEAMACGVPVIASSRDGSREAVKGGELGRVVDPDDREALLSAVLEALSQPRTVPAGLESFSFENFARRVSGAIQTVQAAHG